MRASGLIAAGGGIVAIGAAAAVATQTPKRAASARTTASTAREPAAPSAPAPAAPPVQHRTVGVAASAGSSGPGLTAVAVAVDYSPPDVLVTAMPMRSLPADAFLTTSVHSVVWDRLPNLLTVPEDFYTWAFDETNAAWMLGYRNGSPVSSNRWSGLAHSGKSLLQGRGRSTAHPLDFAFLGVDDFLPSKTPGEFYAGRKWDDGQLVEYGVPRVLATGDDWDEALELWNLPALPVAFARGYLLMGDLARRAAQTGSILVLGPVERHTARERDLAVEAVRTGSYKRVLAALDTAGRVMAVNRLGALYEHGDTPWFATVLDVGGDALSATWRFVSRDLWSELASWSRVVPLFGDEIGTGFMFAGRVVRFPVDVSGWTVDRFVALTDKLGIPRYALIAGALMLLGPVAFAQVGSGGLLGAVVSAGEVASQYAAVRGLADNSHFPASVRGPLVKVIDIAAKTIVEEAAARTVGPTVSNAAAGLVGEEATAQLFAALDGLKVDAALKDAIAQAGVDAALREAGVSRAQLKGAAAAYIQSYFNAIGATFPRKVAEWSAMGPGKFFTETQSWAQNLVPYGEAHAAINAARASAVGLRPGSPSYGITVDARDVPAVADRTQTMDPSIRRLRTALARPDISRFVPPVEQNEIMREYRSAVARDDADTIARLATRVESRTGG